MRDTQRHTAIEFFGQVKIDRAAADLAVLDVRLHVTLRRIDRRLARLGAVGTDVGRVDQHAMSLAVSPPRRVRGSPSR